MCLCVGNNLPIYKIIIAMRSRRFLHSKIFANKAGKKSYIWFGFSFRCINFFLSYHSAELCCCIVHTENFSVIMSNIEFLTSWLVRINWQVLNGTSLVYISLFFCCCCRFVRRKQIAFKVADTKQNKNKTHIRRRNRDYF